MSSENQSNIRARAAGTYNEPFEPYFNQTYKRPPHVRALYPDPDVQYDTPAFTKKDHAFTTQEEMLAFLKGIVSTCTYARVETIGYSLEGREVPMVLFSRDQEGSQAFKQKPTVWLQALVHGSEPAAGESTLVVAQKLAHGSLGEVLEHINVVIIPRINPDSAYYFDRNSTTNLNGNRDYINLEMVELQAVHTTFNRFAPEVVIDAHEYGAMPQYKNMGDEGGLKAEDVLLLAGNNLNIPNSIRTKADEWFIQEAFTALDKKGYIYDTYYVVTDSDFANPRVMEGGLEAGTGRNAFALKPSFSILVETLGITIGRDSFLRRVDSQVTTHESILRSCAEKAQDVKDVLTQAKQEIIHPTKEEYVVLESKQTVEYARTVQAVDIASGEVMGVDVESYRSTDAIPTIMRKRPTAYLLPPAFGMIVEKLKLLGAHVERIETGVELEVECYTVVERKISQLSDRPLSHLKTSINEAVRYFPPGSFVIQSAQPAAYLISLSLEPESMDSYFTYNFVPVYVDGELPVYRYMKKKLQFIAY